jgi:hypothetical protein
MVERSVHRSVSFQRMLSRSYLIDKHGRVGVCGHPGAKLARVEYTGVETWKSSPCTTSRFGVVECAFGGTTRQQALWGRVRVGRWTILWW